MPTDYLGSALQSKKNAKWLILQNEKLQRPAVYTHISHRLDS